MFCPILILSNGCFQNILGIDYCGNSQYPDIDDKKCTSSLLTVTVMSISDYIASFSNDMPNMDDQTVYLTVCDENTRLWQVPLLITSTIMILSLVLSFGPIYILHRTLDPIRTMVMSQYCYPALHFASIWPQDKNQKLLHGPILHFVLNPSQETFAESNQKLEAKTGFDLIHWSIKNGYLEIIQKILGPEIGECAKLALIQKVLMEGDSKVIKMILDEAKMHLKCTIDIDKDGLHAVMEQFSNLRGI